MRWSSRFGVFAAGACSLTLAMAAYAAAPISNSLQGFTGDSTQAGTQGALTTAGLSVFSTSGLSDNGTPGDTGDDSNPTVAFNATGARFGTLFAGDGGRNYMRTVDSDYATVDFTAEITFEVTSNDQATFFGLGSGDTALFGTPDWSTQLSSGSFWPEPGNDKITVFRTANDINAFVDKPVAGFEPGVHRLRMTFNATTGLLVGSIDVNYAGGAFTADETTLPIATRAGASPLFAADGWPGEPSRIFFGGDDGATFRDFSVSVVPEPTTAAMFAAAVLALVRRRKR